MLAQHWHTQPQPLTVWMETATGHAGPGSGATTTGVDGWMKGSCWETRSGPGTGERTKSGGNARHMLGAVKTLDCADCPGLVGRASERLLKEPHRICCEKSDFWTVA